jgi:hypothetical protein
VFNLIPSSASSKRKVTSELQCPSRTDSVRYGGILGGIGAWVLLYVLSTSAHTFSPVIAGTPSSPQQGGHRHTLAPTIESTIRTLVQAADRAVGASPVDARSITLEDGVTDLRELADSVVAMSSPDAASGGNLIDVRVAPPIVARILAGELRDGQLVVQMLENAIGVVHRVPVTAQVDRSVERHVPARPLPTSLKIIDASVTRAELLTMSIEKAAGPHWNDT